MYDRVDFYLSVAVRRFLLESFCCTIDSFTVSQDFFFLENLWHCLLQENLWSVWPYLFCDNNSLFLCRCFGILKATLILASSLNNIRLSSLSFPIASELVGSEHSWERWACNLILYTQLSSLSFICTVPPGLTIVSDHFTWHIWTSHSTSLMSR